MQSWEPDPDNLGDYKMSGGSPVQTNSLRVPAYIRLKVKKGKWMYAPNLDYGSDLDQIRKLQTNRDIVLFERTAEKALQPMVDDGRAATIAIDFRASARGGIGLNSRIFQANGIFEDLNLQSVG